MAERREFGKRFPEEKKYRHSLAEETEALLAAVGVLEKLDADKSTVKMLEERYGVGSTAETTPGRTE
jgi:hypothetical protein